MLRRAGLVVFIAAAAIGGREAGAQDAADTEPRRCVSLSSIDRTEVIDDQTIAFYLRGGAVYLNRLDRACRGLDRDQPFSYRTSTGQLCSIDVIRVVESFGPGANFGDTCALGPFVPSDEAEIEVLKGEVEPIEVEAEEVEVEEAEVREIEVDDAQTDE